MATTLTVIHRGAALWVNRTTAGYWEVLMPDVTLEYGKDETPLLRHFPKLRANAEYSRSGVAIDVDITDHTVHLTGLNPGASTPLNFSFMLPLEAGADSPVRSKKPFSSSRVLSAVRMDPTASLRTHGSPLGEFNFPGKGSGLFLSWAVEWTASLNSNTLDIPLTDRHDADAGKVELKAHNGEIVVNLTHLSKPDEPLPFPQPGQLFEPDYDFAGLYALTQKTAGVPKRAIPRPDLGFGHPSPATFTFGSEVEEAVNVMADLANAVAKTIMSRGADAKDFRAIADRAAAIANTTKVDPTHLCSNGYVEPPI